jgi:hypothetical protein
VVVSLPAPIVVLLLPLRLDAVPLVPLVLLEVSLELGVVAAVLPLVLGVVAAVLPLVLGVAAVLPLLLPLMLPLVLGVAAVLPVLGVLPELDVLPDELGVPGGEPLGVPERPVLAPSPEVELAPAAEPLPVEPVEPELCAMATPPMAKAAAAARVVRVFLVVVMS